MGRARTFTLRREIEDAFPKLDADRDMPLDQFNDLLADYRLPKAEWVRCQLVDERGRCKKQHGWGWIGELQESGAVGFLGHDCAQDHFARDPRFAALFEAAVARVGREISTSNLVRRLEGLLSDPAFAPMLEAARRKWRMVDDQVKRTRASLRPETLRRLTERMKRGNMEVRVRVLYTEPEIDEKTKKPRQVLRPQESRVGALSGVEGLDMGPLNRIGGKLARAEAALNNAVASEAQPDETMKKWATALESVRPAAKELDRIEAAIARFCRPDNLKLLWLLEKETLAQIAVVNVALELTTRRRVRDEEAIATREGWVQEIKDAHKGFPFEVIT